MKDGSYRPFKAVAILSDLHQSQHLPGTISDNPTPLKFFMLLAAVGLVITTALGIIMAFRFSQSKVSVVVCLVAGVVIPIAILLIYR